MAPFLLVTKSSPPSGGGLREKEHQKFVFPVSLVYCIFKDFTVYIPHVNSTEIRANTAWSEIFDSRARIQRVRESHPCWQPTKAEVYMAIWWPFLPFCNAATSLKVPFATYLCLVTLKPTWRDLRNWRTPIPSKRRSQILSYFDRPGTSGGRIGIEHWWPFL